MSLDSFDFRKSVPVVISVVLPASRDRSMSGRIFNLTVRNQDNSGWLEKSSTAEFGWDLKQEFKTRGYLLVSEAYRLEGNDEGAQAYKRYVRDWKTGQTTESFPIDLLPAEVLRRQRGEHADTIDPWRMPKPFPTLGKATDPDSVSTSKPARSKTRKPTEDLGDEE